LPFFGDIASPESSNSASGRVIAISHNPSKKQQLTNMTMGDDIIKLNVGGQIFVTTRATLCAESFSMLYAMITPGSPLFPPKELDGGIFLDRDPITFRYALSYLRNGRRIVSDIPDVKPLKDLRADADYIGLIGLSNACRDALRAKEALLAEEQTKLRALVSIGIMIILVSFSIFFNTSGNQEVWNRWIKDWWTWESWESYIEMEYLKEINE
jgi:hypothetical protein